MNKRECAILLRLYSILHDVPGANLGASTQSASISGAVTFAKDMEAIKGPVELVLYYIRIGEYGDAENMLGAMEAWRELRARSDWRDVYPFPLVVLQ